MPPALQSSSKSIAGSRSLMYKRPTAVRLFFSIVGSLVAIFGGLWLFVTHSFLFWIVLVLAVMIGWAIHKNKLMEQTRSRLQSKYRFDDLYVSTDDRSFVGVIFVSDQLVVGKAELDSAYPFAQITAVEVIENGVTITRTNRGSQNTRRCGGGTCIWWSRSDRRRAKRVNTINLQHPEYFVEGDYR